MKKLRSSQKRKWIVNGLLAFGAVAILTTGFATWIVGVNQNQDTGNVNVQVDTAKKNNISFSFDIVDDKNIFIGEQTGSETGDYVTIEDEQQTDFNVGIQMNIEIGDDVSPVPNTITLKINSEGSLLDEGTDNSAAKGNTVEFADDISEKTGVKQSTVTHAEGTYTYIDIADEYATIKLPSENGNDWTITKNNGGTQYSFKNSSVTLFKWGSFFGNVSPSKYYNNLYEKGTLKNTSEHVNLVFNELDEMRSVFMNKSEGEPATWTPKTLNILATLSYVEE